MKEPIQPKILKKFASLKVTHLQAAANYTILHFEDGQKTISGYSLKVFEALFKEQSYIRIDRSNLVNKTFISGTQLRENGAYILLKNKSELLIPRRRKAQLLDKHPSLFNSTLNSI